MSAYATLEQFQSWATTRLIDFYAYNNLQIEAALTVVSEDFIDPNYTFKGSKLDSTQEMSLPTTCVSLEAVTNAVCQAAWMQLQGYLFVSDSDMSQREVVSESSKLGELSKSTTYGEGTKRTYTQSTTKIDRLLSPFVIGGAGGIGGVIRG
jgi:hypothetical protein